MRKIKANKKDIEKNQKKIAQLVEELMYHHTKTHDEKKVMELAKKIAELKPKEPMYAERVASIYVDYIEPAEADKAVTYLEENFPPTAYRLFLRSRVCDLKKDYGGCIDYCEKALTMPEVELLTRMMIYNILGHAYRYAGDAPNSLKYYELSGKVDLNLAPNEKIRGYVANIKYQDYSNFLFTLHTLNFSREKIFEEIYNYNKFYEHIEKFVHDPKTHPRHEKLRIGYISPDIREHVVAFFTYAFYKSYDKSRFEVYIYAKNKSDKVTEEFKENTDYYRNILFDTPQVAAQRILEDEIDILVDFSGHTANNVMDILVYKPAPIIISGIGWFNTTGLKGIDYFLVDKYTDPVGLNEKYFTEKMLRLQHSHFCYMWHDALRVVTPAPCVKNGYITFVSFNNFTKVTDELLRVWAKIVNAVPNSKLYLKGKAFREPFGIDAALKRIQAAGISLDRLIYEADEKKYLDKYSRGDIALDSFPYNGGGTTCDALYMGLPVIVLVQERHNSRFGYSLLKNVGLEELCAFSEEEYIQKAVDLANDWDRIREYHLTIRRKMEESPVMNDVIYMGEVEDDYIKIFDAWINGKELPEFPQDAPPVTEEQAENYYNRAREYMQMKVEVKEGNLTNPTYFKRALYYLMLARQADKKHDIEILVFLAVCYDKLLKYGDAYEAICAAGKAIYEQGHDLSEFADDFLAQYHRLQAKLDSYNGKPESAVENYRKAEQFTENLLGKISLRDSALLNLHLTNISSEEMAKAHFEYQKLVDNIQPYTEYHERGEKIKIGYVSGDFRQHAVFTIIFGILASHDKTKFEVTCYSLNPYNDVYTNLIKNQVSNFIEVQNLNYAELAEKIHNDKIDVLIDLSGHSAGNVLPVFAYKPAPVQISGIGYMSTTGLKAMDYFLTDEIVDPPGKHEKYFTEKFLYFPSQFCYAMREDVPTPQYAPCTKRDYIVFGTICRYQKINDYMLKIWKEIIDRVPNSVLLMRAQELVSNSTADQLYGRMKKLGYNMDKVIFQPAVKNYMAELIHIDVILDSYPYVGGSTTLDALYMGVPVVTFYGERRSTRFGLSILKQLGMEGLAVPIDSPQDYIARAVGLAGDIETLDVLHKNLRNMVKNTMSFRPKIYTRSLEEKIIKILNERG